MSEMKQINEEKKILALFFFFFFWAGIKETFFANKRENKQHVYRLEKIELRYHTVLRIINACYIHANYYARSMLH